MERVTQKEAVENLANAIIVRAVQDYHAALIQYKKAKSRKKKLEAKTTVNECEAFFRSSWFGTLTDVDPEALIIRLRRKAQ